MTFIYLHTKTQPSRMKIELIMSKNINIFKFKNKSKNNARTSNKFAHPPKRGFENVFSNSARAH